MASWQLQEAKGKLSEVVKRAVSEGPQNITVRGELVAVLISSKEYADLTSNKPSLVDFLRNSPFVGEELNCSRAQTPTRELAL